VVFLQSEVARVFRRACTNVFSTPKSPSLRGKGAATASPNLGDKPSEKFRILISKPPRILEFYLEFRI
jgi:hypothetical protein